MVVAAAASLALSAATILRRPDLVQGAEFLFHDTGHNLLVADALLHGRTLYRDIFFPYGPLAAYTYAGFAWLAGNTPAAYALLFACVSAINMALVYALARRVAGPSVAALVTTAALAVVPIPGALAGAYMTSPFIVFERTALLAIALLWQPPRARSIGRSVWIGIVFGVWQGFKFGGAFVGGAAVVALDAIGLLASGGAKTMWVAWIRSLAVTLVAFLGVEAIWIGYAFATQPPAIARDVVFPLYMFDAYDVIDASVRWPAFTDWRLIVGQYLLPLSAGAIGVAGFIRWIGATRRDSATARDGASFVFLAFYAIATFGYFHHVYHFQQFLWMFVPTAAYGLERRGRMVRTLAAAAWMPGLLIVLRASLWTAMAPGTEVVHLPSGGNAFVSPAISDRLRFLDEVRASTGGGPIVYAGVGSGWQYAYRVPVVTRHTFFFAPQAIRPYERQAFVDSFDRVAAIVDCGDGANARFIFDVVRTWKKMPGRAGCDVYRR